MQAALDLDPGQPELFWFVIGVSGSDVEERITEAERMRHYIVTATRGPLTPFVSNAV